MANYTVFLFGNNDIRLYCSQSCLKRTLLWEAWVALKPDDSLIHEIDSPEKEPNEGEVSVSMRDCGICGSDTHMVQAWDGKPAVAVGHEASGVVTKIGKGVTALKVGDRVALEPGHACNACKNCYRGKENACLKEEPFNLLEPEHLGYMTGVKVMKASHCHKLPDNLSSEEGAFMEPLAVAVHDCRKSGVEAGKSVLILGAGTIGLLCMMTAKAMGATNICITDVVEDRLKLATELGAPTVINTSSRDHDDVIKEIHDTMGEAPDIVMDCTGVEWCLQLAILSVVPGGVVCVIGRGTPQVTLPIEIANERQLTILNCWRYDRLCFPIAIDLVSKGKVNVARLVTHRYSLEEIKEAFKTAIERDSGALKVMVKCNADK